MIYTFFLGFGNWWNNYSDRFGDCRTNKRISKGILIIFFILFSLVSLTSFSVISATAVHVYLLLIFLYISLISLAFFNVISDGIRAVVLLLTSSLSSLILIDPSELGMYGYDPYLRSMPAYEKFLSGGSIGEVAQVEGAWPLMYSFTSNLHYILGLNIETSAKYAPLISASAPIFIFVTLRYLTNSNIALLTAIGVTSTRSLPTFYGKFVEESFAVALFFIFMLVIYTCSSSKRSSILLIPLAAGIVLAHHASSALLLLFLAVYIISQSKGIERFPTYLIPSSRMPRNHLVIAAFGSILLVGFMIFLAPEFSSNSISIFLSAILEGNTSSTNANLAKSPQGLRALISRTSIIALGLFILICAISVLSTYRLSNWEFTWIGYGAIVSFFYSVTLLLGRVIPLYPNRLLIYLVPMVIAPALAFLYHRGISRQYIQIFSAFLIVCFMVTQVSAIAPHELVTDRSTIILEESHFSESQHSASQWSSSHFSGTVSSYERDIWAAYDNEAQSADQISDCNNVLFVNRKGTSEDHRSKIFDSGGLSLHRC